MSLKTIDVHTHYVIKEYYDFVHASGRIREDGFPMPDWYTFDNHLALMDELEIDWSLLSIASPQPYYEDDAAAVALARILNERVAEFRDKHPTRIGFSAYLPHPNLDAAIEEAIYCLDVLGASAVKLASNARGLYMGDPKMNPLFEELNKRHAIITMHPHRPEPQQESVWSAGPIPVFEFICDTTRAVINMIANGVFERYPDIRLIVPHNGSFLPNIYERFPIIVDFLAEKGLMDRIDVKKSYAKLYFDCSGDPIPSNLEFLLTTTTPDRVLYGSDYPFSNAEISRKKIKGLREHFDENPRLKPYKEMIFGGNAQRLLGIKDN